MNDKVIQKISFVYHIGMHKLVESKQYNQYEQMQTFPQIVNSIIVELPENMHNMIINNPKITLNQAINYYAEKIPGIETNIAFLTEIHLNYYMELVRHIETEKNQTN